MATTKKAIEKKVTPKVATTAETAPIADKKTFTTAAVKVDLDDTLLTSNGAEAITNATDEPNNLTEITVLKDTATGYIKGEVRPVSKESAEIFVANGIAKINS